MNVQTVLFYLFSAILVFAALRVVTARNPVHAALWLVLAFFTAAAHWLMLRAEFLAIALVLVYVGAVMVLFLFVVMMLDVNFDNLRTQFKSYLPVGATVFLLVLIEMALVLLGNQPVGAAGAGAAAAGGRQQHGGAGLAPLHRLRLPVRDRRGDPAGRDRRGDRADAPPAPRDEASGSGGAGENPAAGQVAHLSDEVREERIVGAKTASQRAARAETRATAGGDGSNEVFPQGSRSGTTFRASPRCRTTSCWGRCCSPSAWPASSSIGGT